ncbi:ABC transporter substrate-binding protein [Paracoccus onubensis]|uniref:ABC transporter substrate-binding protein n=1 Tax=Paracoccus onubensis TaxID=1675788 RepID=UPI0027317B41|nr:ABC transporter substrate-binding protein [Paracoccus onubensis]MDP0926473.1 ABC transporter substrate-binding protein [Paracoccus onubensis]
MINFMTRRSFHASILALMAATATPAFAQEAKLSIGMAAPITSLDPHEDSNSPNNATSRHIWDSLIDRGGMAENKPQLASEWEVIDDTHWRFKLREGVTFHDGSAFDAEDVVASLIRARDKDSQAFAAYTRNIANVTAEDEHTVVVETTVPDPLILNSLSRIRIISSEFADAPVAEFENGPAAVGTGPFKLVSYNPGDRVELERNDDYFAGPADWSHVTLRFVPDEGGRLASFLAGDLDLIENLPAEGVQQVENNSKLKITRGQSTRLVYLGMDVSRDESPFVTAKDGSPLDSNPFKDERVRKALLMAMDREAIVDRIMQQNGTVAHQYVAEGFFGHSDDVEEVGYDPEAAKALLAEAGYPDGFAVTIHGPSGRYVNDSEVVQAAGQMLTRIGIDTKVEVMPWSVYSGKYSEGAYSVFLGAWGVNTGEVSNPALAIVAGRDAERGTGRYNGGGIDVPEINELLDKATVTLDEDAREPLLQQISALTFNDVWLLPMHYENVVMGAKQNIEFTPRGDKYTLAYEVHGTTE